MKQSTDDIRESKTTDIDDLDTAIISFAGAVRKETLALGVNDPSYEVQPLFSPFKAKLQTLIDQEVKKARIDELNELNYQIAKNSWHKENAYKMYPYILDRIAELEKDNK
jgi:molybdopterin synthase catalytic subunit